MMPEHIEIEKPTANRNKQSMADAKRSKAKTRPFLSVLNLNQTQNIIKHFTAISVTRIHT